MFNTRNRRNNRSIEVAPDCYIVMSVMEVAIWEILKQSSEYVSTDYLLKELGNNIDSLRYTIHKLNKKLERYQVRIENAYDKGYRIGVL